MRGATPRPGFLSPSRLPAHTGSGLGGAVCVFVEPERCKGGSTADRETVGHVDAGETARLGPPREHAMRSTHHMISRVAFSPGVISAGSRGEASAHQPRVIRAGRHPGLPSGPSAGSSVSLTGAAASTGLDRSAVSFHWQPAMRIMKGPSLSHAGEPPAACRTILSPMEESRMSSPFHFVPTRPDRRKGGLS